MRHASVVYGMYDRILFPTDGSEESARVFEHALGLAAAHGATLSALYVVDDSVPYGDIEGGTVNWEPVLEAMREDGREAVTALETRAADAGVDFEGEVREGGVIHRTILDCADEVGADLIVMGTHGRRGLNRWLLGSVTERVVRTARIPVLTVRIGAGEDSDDGGDGADGE
jgi:nucleotide-binding universal stress UspA family protein